jgi:nucleoside-diphosphate-sugar epimerase
VKEMTKKFSKILVTGGAGFIGSHIVDRLLEEGYHVTVFDNLTTGSLKNIPHFSNKNFTFIKGDIRDLDALKLALQDVDAVFHEAAFVSVPLSVKEPFQSNDLNVNGTLNVLMASVDLKVKRLVFASTAAVYGSDESSKKTERMIPDPSNPYGVSKLAAEHYVRSFSDLYGIETVSLRYFNAYGPRQSFDPNFESGGAITIFFNRLIRDLSPIIFGDGKQTRDFVYVGDLVEANMLALTSKKANGDFFNIGNGTRITINAVIDNLKHLLHKENIKNQYAPVRLGDNKHGYADIAKATEVLGYHPKFPLAEGLENLVKWYNLNK